MIKNLIFDFGGVITDSDLQSAIDAFKRIGFADVEQYLNAYQQAGMFNQLEEGRIGEADFVDKLSRLVGRRLTWEEVQSGWCGFSTGVSQAKLDLLTELRADYRIYLLSNTNPFMMSWARSTEFTPAGHPLDYYFDKLYLSYRIGLTKPSPEIFRYMLQDANIKAEESVFVDDGMANIRTAHSLGFITLQPTNNADWRKALLALLAGGGGGWSD